MASPGQVGYDSFYMIKSVQGWQILPNYVEEDDSLELPSIAPQRMPKLFVE
jgi:hypothetical protein